MDIKLNFLFFQKLVPCNLCPHILCYLVSERRKLSVVFESKKFCTMTELMKCDEA